MHRDESPLLRAARQRDLDWDITTSVLVMLGLMVVVGATAAGLVWLFDALIWLVEA